MKVVTNLDKKITDDNIVNYKRKKTTSEIIDEQEEIIQTLIENMPIRTTEQATEITVDDAVKYNRNKLEIFGNTEQRVFKGYNLFNKESENIVNNCRLNQSGENMNAEGYFISDYIEIDKNEEYTISYVPDAFTRIVFYSEDKTYINRNDKSQTYTAPETAVYLRFCNLLTEIDNIQIVKGRENKPYEPFTNLQPSPSTNYKQNIHIVAGENVINVNDTQYQLNLKDIELRKVGDYQDVLFKNERKSPFFNVELTEDDWYMLQITDYFKITEEQINNGFIDNNGTYPCFTTRAGNYIRNISQSLCEYLKSAVSIATVANNSEYNNYFVYGSGSLTIRIDDFSTVEEYQNWLKSVDFKILGALKEPTYKKITDETLISQLEELYAHIRLEKGTNNITVTAEDLAPLMQLTYMQDIQSRLNNIEAIALEANS